MNDRKRLLILGGTTEAAALAAKACQRFGDRLDVISSLAGRVKPERQLPGTVRVGGFGGATGLADYLKSEHIELLVDATHPFAETISAHAHDASLTANIPRLVLERPRWELPPRAKRLDAADMAEAAALVSRFAKRVLVTTGQKDLNAFRDCGDVHFFIRLIEAPTPPPPIKNQTLLISRPPYGLEGERALMDAHNIDCLLAKDSGGEATVGKIVAAVERDIYIILLTRPLAEPGEAVGSVEGAVAWLERRV